MPGQNETKKPQTEFNAVAKVQFETPVMPTCFMQHIVCHMDLTTTNGFMTEIVRRGYFQKYLLH